MFCLFCLYKAHKPFVVTPHSLAKNVTNILIKKSDPNAFGQRWSPRAMHPEPWPPVEIDAKSLSQTVVANSFSGFLFTWSWQRPRGSSPSSTNSSSSSSCTPLCSLSRLCTICVPVHGHLLLHHPPHNLRHILQTTTAMANLPQSGIHNLSVYLGTSRTQHRRWSIMADSTISTQNTASMARLSSCRKQRTPAGRSQLTRPRFLARTSWQSAGRSQLTHLRLHHISDLWCTHDRSNGHLLEQIALLVA